MGELSPSSFLGEPSPSSFLAGSQLLLCFAVGEKKHPINIFKSDESKMLYNRVTPLSHVI